MIFYPSRRWVAVLGVLGFLVAASAQASSLLIYSDAGTVTPTFFFWPNDGSVSPPDGSSKAVPAAEGVLSYQMISPAGGGWGVFYPLGSPQNLSAFGSGQIRFWLRSTTGNIKAEIEYADLSKESWDLSPYWNAATMTNVWTLFSLPLNGVPLTNIYSPFEITSTVGGTFYVDDVEYLDTTATSIFNVALRNVSDGSLASPAQVSWSNVTLPKSWVLSDQYVELEVQPDNVSWGVQIYTDNMAGDANPPFSTTAHPGDSGSNPAGLVNRSLPSKTLPLAWSIKGSTISAPSVADPGNAADPNSFQWLYMVDRATPAIVSEHTNAFADGAAFQVVKSNVGLHFGQAPADFGSAVFNHPSKIYFQTNFSTAVTQRTYRTSKLFVEYFTP
jgi:hypothetical protein